MLVSSNACAVRDLNPKLFAVDFWKRLLADCVTETIFCLTVKAADRLRNYVFDVAILPGRDLDVAPRVVRLSTLVLCTVLA